MTTQINAQARAELVRALRSRYQAGIQEEKIRILTEFVAVTGYHRKHAIRILNGREDPVAPVERRGRHRLYDEAVRQAIITLWEAADRICGKRLKPLLTLLVAALEKHRHLKLDPTVRGQVLKLSASTIDRLLQSTRAVAQPRRRPRGAPTLRRRVPVRTFADWKEPPPGSMEMDLVAHCGESIAGSHVFSLVLTDISSGWTECAPLVVREATLLVESLDRIRLTLPFVLRALDVDNGGEFINETLVQYCTDHGIELTRSRPYHKNDQAWIEQKNGAVVRRMVGYHRLEGIAAAQALARLYAASRPFVNFFQPSFKLASKTRTGALIAKRYHTPQTPASRLLASPAIPEPIKDRIRELATTLDPLRLLDEIRAMQQHLALLAQGEHPHTPVVRADDLTAFLTGLATAWRAGEVRPTHTRKQTPARTWRTRVDPFEAVWPEVCRWLAEDPDQNGKTLFIRLQREHPTCLSGGGKGSLRTIQRRLQQWRAEAARNLVFGLPEANAITDTVVGDKLHVIP